jgi:hypothetical protein
LFLVLCFENVLDRSFLFGAVSIFLFVFSRARELESFIKEDIMKYDAVQGQELQQLLHATLHVELPFPLPPEKEKLAPKPIIPKKLVKFDEVPFFNLVSPVECARQMTLLDESM